MNQRVTILFKSLVLALGIGAFGAGTALAEPGCDGMMGGGRAERHAKMRDQHHARLHDALKLTAEQEPAWKKLIESEGPGPRPEGKPEDWSKLKAPERAEKMLELAKARQGRMAEHVAALKAFYAVLTPEQQKVFDEAHPMHQRGMAGRSPDKRPGRGEAPVKAQ